LQRLTDNSGSATFEKTGNLLLVKIEKENYETITTQQFTIFSDTVFTYYLVPKKYEATISVGDQQTGGFFLGTRVTLNNEVQITNEKGETYFEVYPGSYSFQIEKTSYENKNGILTVSSDTTFQILLTRLNGSVKIKITEDVSTPVNNATVILNADTLISTSLGITNFKNLPVYTTYNYTISKTGYKQLSGTLYLSGDTTVTLKMEPLGTAIPENSELQNFRIWPNPVSDLLNIDIPADYMGSTVEILDLKGNSIKRFYAGQNQKVQIQVNNIPAGIYLLQIISHSNQINRLIVKK
jgi:uncharacterized membrane protein